MAKSKYKILIASLVLLVLPLFTDARLNNGVTYNPQEQSFGDVGILDILIYDHVNNFTYLNTGINSLLIGGSSTSTDDAVFEVNGGAYFDTATATQSLTLPSITSECLETDANGLVVGSGSACGSGSGGSINTLGEIGDVSTTTLAVADIIMWDGTNWINQPTTTQIHVSEIDTYAELDVIVADQTLAYSGGAFHDGFSDFVANEHLDWTLASQGTIHATNYVDNDTQLTEEQVEDFAGGMVTGNTETLITVTYQDGDGTIDFVVDNDLANYSNTNSGFLTSTSTWEDITASTTLAVYQDYVWDFSDNTNATAGTGITFSGDEIQSTLGTSIVTGEITNDTILEIDLDVTNSPTDNYILSFDTGTGGFTWVEDQTGGGGSINTLGEIGDVSTTSLAHLDVLYWDNDAGNWLVTATSTWDTDTDTQLTEEQVEDFVGGMLGGTETLITVTYQDGTNDIDFVVDNDLANYSNSSSGFQTASDVNGIINASSTIAAIGGCAANQLSQWDGSQWTCNTIVGTTGDQLGATFYDNTGGVTTGTSFVPINLDATMTNNSTTVFSLASDVVTVNAAGYYLVSYQVTGMSPGNTRTGFQTVLQENTGGGMGDVDGTAGAGYTRTANDPGGTANASVVLDIAAGDSFQIESKADDTSYVTVVDGTRLTFVQLKAPKGDTGATGATGADGADGSGISNWLFGADQTFIKPSTTVGIVISASSTITDLWSDTINATTTVTDVITVNTTINVPAGSIDFGDDTNATGGNAITISGDAINFDGGASPAGDLGGTWASPSVDDDSHNHVFSNIDAFTEANLYTILSDVTQFYEAGDEDTIAAAISEGALANDIILETDLKAVDAASDEDFLTYESTTGDFEWHSVADISALIAADIAEGELADDIIVEADLKAVDSPSDEECLTYETTTGDFEWQTCGAGSSPWTDNGTWLIPTAGEGLVVNASTTITELWSDTVNATTTVTDVITVNTTINVPAGSIDFSDDTNATDGDGITFSGDSITADLGTAITSSEITDNEIIEPDLSADNAASDGDHLTYDSTGTNFAWITPNAGTDITADLEEEVTEGSLADDVITEAELKAVDSPSDEECLTYETTTGDFEWQACGGGSSPWTDNGTWLTPTAGEGLVVNASTTVTDLFSDTIDVDTITVNTAINVPAGSIDFSDDTNATDGDGITFSGDSITADLGTAIVTGEITDGTILEADLDADETAANNDILTFDSTGSNFSWQTPAELSLQPLDSELTTIAGLTETNGNVMFVAGGAWTSDATPAIDGADITGIVTAGITDGTILEADLKIVDSPTDEDFLTYESTTGDFEWHSVADVSATIAADIAEGELANDIIVEADLKAVDSPTDEECLTYETTTGDFEWQACAAGGSSEWTDNGTWLSTGEAGEGIVVNASSTVTELITNNATSTESFVVGTNSGSGDAIFEIGTGGTVKWVFGLDDDQGDEFTISDGDSLGSNNWLEVGANRSATTTVEVGGVWTLWDGTSGFKFRPGATSTIEAFTQ